jgi:hydrogenase expression/formation protein HypD
MMDPERFSDPRLAAGLAKRIRELATAPAAIMEVCGTHTMAIARFGIRSMLPPQVRLISGPGCPVCVTPQADIDRMIKIARQPEVAFCTFGDMVRVPGSRGSLAQARAEGADVRVVYSCLDAVELAATMPDRKVVFTGVGFETTSPTAAAAVLEAERRGLRNFLVYPSFKLVPPALELVLSSQAVRIDGFLLPGHVSAIIGSRPYEFIAEKHGRPGAIAGFEPLDILGAVALLLEMISGKKPAAVRNEYARGVPEAGNPEAMRILGKVFEPADSEWRAIGRVPESGLVFREEYRSFDASKAFDTGGTAASEPQGCRCGEVMMGAIEPDECGLFGTDCIPESPVGPCMVSSEGACAAWHKYGLGRGRS